MRRDRVTPRNQKKKTNRSVSPQIVASKSKLKNFFPANKQVNNENISNNTNDQHSIQICLDLASYHQKEAEVLKEKNVYLDEQLTIQMKDMEELRRELKKIKNVIQHHHSLKKDCEELKGGYSELQRQNERLKSQVKQMSAKIEQLNQEIVNIQRRGTTTQSFLLQTAKKSENIDMRPLSFAKQSRRQQLANKYECVAYVPSSVVCLQCKKIQSELQEVNKRYCAELRQLQNQIDQLVADQHTVRSIEREVKSKSECIEYLVGQLNSMESDSLSILSTMSSLEIKLRDISAENVILKTQVQPQTQPTDRLCHSFSKSAAY